MKFAVTLTVIKKYIFFSKNIYIFSQSFSGGFGDNSSIILYWK